MIVGLGVIVSYLILRSWEVRWKDFIVRAIEGQESRSGGVSPSVDPAVINPLVR